MKTNGLRLTHFCHHFICKIQTYTHMITASFSKNHTHTHTFTQTTNGFRWKSNKQGKEERRKKKYNRMSVVLLVVASCKTDVSNSKNCCLCLCSSFFAFFYLHWISFLLITKLLYMCKFSVTNSMFKLFSRVFVCVFSGCRYCRRRHRHRCLSYLPCT